jgi:hypothetical protein
VLDWHDPEAGVPTPPDVVLGSDLVYADAALPALAATAHRLLRPSRGVFLLVQVRMAVFVSRGEWVGGQ